MRISTRIRWSAVLAIVIALATAAMLLSGLNQVEKAISRNDQVAASLNHIFELSMLTTDYLVNYESRAERQWRSKHADFEAVLATLDVGSAEDTALLSRMKTSSAEAYRLFDEITVAHAEGLSGVVDRTVSEEYQARLTARLLIVMQEMVSDSVRLGENSSTEALSVQRNTYLLVLALALAAITIMVVIGLSTHRTIVRPLLLLRDNAQEVGRGNLDTRSGITSADEVGELATAFDSMVDDLRTSYSMLEKEVAERRRAEEELSEYRDHLEQIVESRTAELVALNEDLRRATRAKDEFMASMSHELRTPLNSIIGFTDIMLRGLAGDLTDEQRRQLSMVLHSGQQLLMLIDDVLDLARLDAGQAHVVLDDLPVAEAVGTLVDMMAPIAAAQRLTLTWQMDDGVPATVRTDRGKVDQIMLNLLSNALKFTDEGEVEVAVRPAEDGGVTFEVRDTGVGIPADEVEAIFEHFHRAQTDPTRVLPGTGLGLAISRRLAEAIGGRITVSSQPGAGSVFALTVPGTPPAPDAAATPDVPPADDGA